MFRWFERLVEPYPPDAPEIPPATTFGLVWHYTRGIWPVVALMALFAGLVGLGEAFLFYFLGQLVDWLANESRETFLAEEGWTLALMAAFVLLVLPVLNHVASMLTHQALAGNYPMRIRWLGHRLLLRQSMGFFADEFAGRVATKLMQTALAVRDTVMRICEMLVYVLAFLVGMLAIAAGADVRLMLPMLAWVVVYVAILVWFVPRLGRVGEEQADARSVMTGRVVDAYTNIQSVKLFSHARREEAYARNAMDGFLGTVHRQMRLITWFNSLIYFSNAVLLFAVGAVAIRLWLLEAVTLGEIAVAIALVMRLAGISQWIMWEAANLFESIGTVADGRELLSRPVAVVDPPAPRPLAVDRGAIRFEDVTFHYGKEGGVIEKLDLSVAPGEKVGLVGPSGAGKTTLVNLLLRLHDLEGGRILIDGQDIAAVRQDDLRAAIGVVTQEPALLHRSIRDNIAYGRPEATDEEVIAAARRAEALPFVEGLVDASGRAGLDAHVGERGVRLSGGQRQRIAIARVFLKDAPILVLDEATSALDSEVEAAIQASLFELMEGKTVIAIAHRLSTIAALDRLVVLDRGRVVEEGRHADLVAADGLYARLWQRQSGGFIADRLPAAAAE